MQPKQNPYKHPSTLQSTTGFITFAAGEIIETYHDQLICVDSGELISEGIPLPDEYFIGELPIPQEAA